MDKIHENTQDETSNEQADQIYPIALLHRLKHDYNPRDVPNELRNFKCLLTKCPQLHKQLQLIKEVNGIFKLNPNLIDPGAAAIRKLTSILNRLNEDNYERMLNEVRHFSSVSDATVVRSIIDVVIHNIKLSHTFIKLYASLTRDVDKFQMWDMEGIPFSAKLSRKCFDYFDTFQTPEARDELRRTIDSLSDSDDRNDTEARIKRENKAIVLFLGHLYINGLLSLSETARIADRLLLPLPGDEKLDDFNIDYFLALYPVIKPKMITSSSRTTAEFEERLMALREEELSFRLKFMLEDFLKVNGLTVVTSKNTSSHRTAAAAPGNSRRLQVPAHAIRW